MITCGVDPSRGSICVSYVEDMVEIDYKEYENGPGGYKVFVEDIHGMGGVEGVYIEGYGDTARSLMVYLKEEGIKVYEVNPHMLSRLREGITEQKTDHIDSYVCGLIPFFWDIKEIKTKLEVEEIKVLGRAYIRVIREIVRFKNQLHSSLHHVFGKEYKRMFRELNETSIRFFMRFNSYEKIKGARVEEIHEVIGSVGSKRYKGEHGLRKAMEIKEIAEGVEYSDGMKEFLEAEGYIITVWGELLLKSMEKAKELKEAIEERVKEVFPGYKEYFRDIRGMTPLRFGILMGEIKDIKRFSKEGELASYAGQAPCKYQSGLREKERHKRKYNRFLAHVIHQIACDNVRKNAMYYEEYKHQKERMRVKLRALKTVKRKIVRLLYYRLLAYENLILNNAA